MKLTEHHRKSNNELYYVIEYEDDDGGFHVWRRGNLRLYPVAILVYPKTSGWIAKINWANFGSLSKQAVLTEVFTVADKQIAAINDTDKPTTIHASLWIHCSMLIKKYGRDKAAREQLALPPDSAAVVVPPVWKVWSKLTIPEFERIGDELF